jgi:hypothetical protein
MIELEPAMIYRLHVTGPAEAGEGSPSNPRRQFWQMTGATLEGQWDDQYMRMALTFDTSDERYAWLMTSLFIARGRLLSGKAIEYDVYRVR